MQNPARLSPRAPVAFEPDEVNFPLKTMPAERARGCDRSQPPGMTGGEDRVFLQKLVRAQLPRREPLVTGSSLASLSCGRRSGPRFDSQGLRGS